MIIDLLLQSDNITAPCPYLLINIIKFILLKFIILSYCNIID